MSTPRGSSSAGKASSSAGGKGTLLGFFRKVDGPAPARVQASSTPEAAKATASRQAPVSSKVAQPSVVNKASQASSSAPKVSVASTSTKTAFPSPPSSTSGRSVSPIAPRVSNDTPVTKKIGTPSAATRGVGSPFKSPTQPASASRPSREDGESARRSLVGVNARSGQPTPPSSSPATAQLLEDEGLDEEDVMPSSSRVSVSTSGRHGGASVHIC